MKHIGDQGEIIALKYLQKKGYQILATNFKYGRWGEIDIIGKHDEKTIFFEVKFRRNTLFGIPEESISRQKLKKCLKSLQFYCLQHHIALETAQFDVLSIMQEETSYKITHHKNIEI